MNKPYYIISVVTNESTKINKLFESGESSVRELLRNPGGLRYAGWDLETLDNPRIVKGEYLEVNNSERKILRLYEDGTFIFRCSADGEFLGWPRHGEEFNQKPRLNPLAVIESTYCFVDFYRKIVPFLSPAPVNLVFKLKLTNAFLGENKKIYIIPFALNTYGWMFEDDRCHAPDNVMDLEVAVDRQSLVNNHAHVAFLLVRKFFLWFGVPEDKIPYVKITNENNGIKIIDIDKIINSK